MALPAVAAFVALVEVLLVALDVAVVDGEAAISTFAAAGAPSALHVDLYPFCIVNMSAAEHCEHSCTAWGSYSWLRRADSQKHDCAAVGLDSQLVTACWSIVHCWAQEGHVEGMRLWAMVGAKRMKRAEMVEDFIVNEALAERASRVESKIVLVTIRSG